MIISSLTRFLALLLLFAVIGTVIILLAQGYTLNPKGKTLEKTGIISIEAIPEGASVYLDDELHGTTDTAIRNLPPGDYHLKLTKEHFYPWERTLHVETSAVTEVIATLYPSTPELKPLTFEGVNRLIASDDDTLLVYGKNQGLKPGVYMVDLSGSLLGLVFDQSYSPKLLIEDTETVSYSLGEYELSPDNQTLLITVTAQDETGADTATVYQVDLEKDQTPVEITVKESEALRDSWAKTRALKQQEQTERIQVVYPSLIEVKDPVLSTDNKSLYYLTDDQMTTIVFDDNTNTVTKTFTAPSLTPKWLPDSQHIAFVTFDAEKKLGSIVITELDGKNNTPIYSGPLETDQIHFSADGKQLLVLANYSPLQKSSPNIYSISLTGE